MRAARGNLHQDRPFASWTLDRVVGIESLPVFRDHLHLFSCRPDSGLICYWIHYGAQLLFARSFCLPIGCHHFFETKNEQDRKLRTWKKRLGKVRNRKVLVE